MSYSYAQLTPRSVLVKSDQPLPVGNVKAKLEFADSAVQALKVYQQLLAIHEPKTAAEIKALLDKYPK